MLSDSETFERVIARSLDLKHVHPLKDLIADREAYMSDETH